MLKDKISFSTFYLVKKVDVHKYLILKKGYNSPACLYWMKLPPLFVFPDLVKEDHFLLLVTFMGFNTKGYNNIRTYLMSFLFLKSLFSKASDSKTDNWIFYNLKQGTIYPYFHRDLKENTMAERYPMMIHKITPPID